MSFPAAAGGGGRWAGRESVSDRAESATGVEREIVVGEERRTENMALENGIEVCV